MVALHATLKSIKLTCCYLKRMPVQLQVYLICSFLYFRALLRPTVHHRHNQMTAHHLHRPVTLQRLSSTIILHHLKSLITLHRLNSLSTLRHRHNLTSVHRQQSAYRPSAMSNETSNGYFLERSESARVTLAKAVELRTKIMGRSDTKL